MARDFLTPYRIVTSCRICPRYRVPFRKPASVSVLPRCLYKDAVVVGGRRLSTSSSRHEKKDERYPGPDWLEVLAASTREKKKKKMMTTTTTTTSKAEVINSVKDVPTFFPPNSSLPEEVDETDRRALLSSDRFGKWRALLYDYDQLSELSSGVPVASEKDDSSRTTERSIDDAENAGDMRLWSAIFNFAQRRDGCRGARIVWRELSARKTLGTVDSHPASRVLFQAILDVAVEDDEFLVSTWQYAEWLLSTRNVSWPNYYVSVISHCLDYGQYTRAIQWTLRLSRHFGLSRDEFFALLREYLVDGHDTELQATLRTIYLVSGQRSMYDLVVPFLYSKGYAKAAMEWRDMFVRHDDLPSSVATRPFLLYLMGYYPKADLSEQERTLSQPTATSHGLWGEEIKEAAAATPTPTPSATPTATPPPTPTEDNETDAELDELYKTMPDMQTNLSYLWNRMHGETFGISEKTFSDRFGARFFATQLIGLDTAIQLVYGLGIHEIGPLSLKSIALRENGGDLEAVRHRLEQLQRLQISVGTSSYARALCRFARVGDGELLRDLVECTVHPDVFDDPTQQQPLAAMRATAAAGDWKTVRVLMAVRLAVAQDVLATTANEVLVACLDQRKRNATMRVLQEMFLVRRIELAPTALEAIVESIRADVPSVQQGQEQQEGGREGTCLDPPQNAEVDFYVALCQKLWDLRVPVSAAIWRRLLVLLGSQGRMDDFARLASDLMDRYVIVVHGDDSSDAFLRVHRDDVPEIMRREPPLSVVSSLVTPAIYHRLVPRDLSLRHPMHPIRLVFDEPLMRGLVRWYFHRKTAYRLRRGLRWERGASEGSHSSNKLPQDFGMAGGVRLLAMLRDRGLVVPVEIVRNEVLAGIASVFGQPTVLMPQVWRPARGGNQLTLAEVKDVCEVAWRGNQRNQDEDDEGGDKEELLPSVEAIQNALQALQPGPVSLLQQYRESIDPDRGHAVSVEEFIRRLERQAVAG